MPFRYGPEVHAGVGAVACLPTLLPPGRVLFVTDRGVRAAGLADAVATKVDAVVFDAVEPDPSRATLMAAVAAGRDGNVASVVGLGGGSPMDVAKLAAYLLGSGDDLDAIWGVEQATGTGLPCVLVPTTAGTGSEATPVSIITLPDGEKRGVNSRALVAGHAILDPELTLGLPRSTTAATGVDAMVHAIEATTSARLRNPVSTALAAEALRLLAANIRTACDKPGDLMAREAMLVGAHLAGVAFANAPVAGVHALAYPLARYGLPHGVTNALTLVGVLRHNLPAAAPDYARLARQVDPGLRDADGLIAALQQVIADVGLPTRLRDAGVPRADLRRLAADAMRHERLLVNNPVPIGEADALRIYEAAW